MLKNFMVSIGILFIITVLSIKFDTYVFIFALVAFVGLLHAWERRYSYRYVSRAERKNTTIMFLIVGSYVLVSGICGLLVSYAVKFDEGESMIPVLSAFSFFLPPAMWLTSRLGISPEKPFWPASTIGGANIVLLLLSSYLFSWGEGEVPTVLFLFFLFMAFFPILYSFCRKFYKPE